jgi:tRNA 2-thiouridine synthesizing protein A
VLEVLATDVGATHDIPAWCRVHGHELLSIEEVDDSHTETAGNGGVRGGHEIRIRLKVRG